MTFKLPANLESGEYLLRSEMLALHGAQTVGGAQFYIGCMQLRITGPGGNCSPKFELPGVYSVCLPIRIPQNISLTICTLKPTETAIYIPNNYAGFNTLTYTAPGGPTATCLPGGSNPLPTSSSPTARPTTTSSSSTKVTSSTRVTSTTPTPTSTGAMVPKWGQCGGIGWTGPTNCPAGTICTKANDYYSQCL